MTSPPLQQAASHLVNLERDTGAPGGNDRKVTEGLIRVPTHADGFGTGRVMTSATRSYAKGQTIQSRLTYALRAPNGQRFPINAQDLHDWVEEFLKWGVNKSGHRALYARHNEHRVMWAGTQVGHVPLKAGSWTVLQSDEDFAVIPQMHTQPLSKLHYAFTPTGTVAARFHTKENTPTAVEFGDVNSNEGPNSMIQEGH